LKALAVTTGLARYGRNNVAYVNGFGSYVQLMAFASGVPVDDLAPNGPRAAALDECQGCKACQAACPTGAIARDRFLIRAERCITWFSEYEGPLPDAFGLAKRPCLVGCTACQEACPVNRGLLRLERLGVRFCRAETEFLLGTGATREAPSGIAAKVEALRCSDCALESGQPIATFRRNLHAVLRHRAAGS
jgi:epoxyqueuosine reductase